ncbi:MAG: DNA replication/repair protein RecF [gamma proteobacterium symbiont of Ctena orbiculata]|nr:MAG: DNA replication/repair protein RecF [gamma proteobacterium symbiont of Ctena orbiculata]
MYIDYLSIENLRNIRSAELSPNRNLNLIVGNNGAGKTTLLESIYLLARAHSFRQTARGRLINDEAEQMNLFARLESSAKAKHQIGLQQHSTKTMIRKDGENLKKLSLLAKALPLTIITPNIQRIVEEDPKHRRRLINWGMFHVEHEYGDLANRYKKALLQRNNALKGSTEQLKVWDRQLVALGTDIHQRMVDYTTLWNKSVNELVASLQLIKPITLEVKQGWKDEMSLSEALVRNFQLDKERGFTSCGPHRSDLKIVQDGNSIKNQFSRGEVKIAAVLMILAQTLITQIRTGECPVLLVDDLHAEIDTERYESLLSMITRQDLQSFITTLSIERSIHPVSDNDFSVFHVEHGCVVRN